MVTFLLVPGAGGQASYWHRVVPLLRAAGREAVAVDLPAANPDAGLAAYADTVVAAARSDPGSGPVTLVASSLAGFSAPLVCDRIDVRRIVLVNAMVPLPGETAGEWWAATGQPAAAVDAARVEGRDPRFDPVRDFFHDVPDDVRAEALAQGEPPQSGRPFADPWPLPGWPHVPTSGVAGRDDRLFPAAFQRRVARERLGLDLEVVPGGHLLALARPEVLTEVLMRG